MYRAECLSSQNNVARLGAEIVSLEAEITDLRTALAERDIEIDRISISAQQNAEASVAAEDKLDALAAENKVLKEDAERLKNHGLLMVEKCINLEVENSRLCADAARYQVLKHAGHLTPEEFEFELDATMASKDSPMPYLTTYSIDAALTKESK